MRSSGGCDGDMRTASTHIQSCGCAFAIEETADDMYPSGLRILGVSQNAVEAPWAYASSVSDLLGKDLGHLLRVECVRTVRSLVTRYAQACKPSHEDDDHISPKANRITADACPSPRIRGELRPGAASGAEGDIASFTVTGSNPGVYLVDVERHGSDCARVEHTPGLLLLGDLLESIPVGSNPVESTAALCDALAKSMPAYDRVMVYRFAPDGSGQDDGSGEVVHESVRAGADIGSSYLNLRFPALDIPPIARKLFKLVGVRFIADTSAPAVPMITLHDQASSPLDLFRSALRAPAECHLRYLRNMGVKASLVVSIAVDGGTWGLFSFHSYTRTVHPSCEERLSVEMAASVVSSLISRYQREEIAATALSLSRTLGNLGNYTRVNDFLSADHHSLLGILDVDAVILCEHLRSVTLYGKKDITLSLEECQELRNGDGDESSEMAISFRTLGARGVAFFWVRSFFVAFLRGSIANSVKWAGNPDAPVNKDEVMTPRASFELFMRTSGARCKAWSPLTVDLLNMVRQGFSSQLYAEALPADLQETFARVSHELRTPFHGVMGALEILEAGNGIMGAEEQLDVIRSALRCGGSMMSTLNDILEIAKDRNNTEVVRGRFSASGPIVLAVAAMGLFAAAESVELTVEIGPPDDVLEVTGDMRRIKAIVQNLVNNAIKFTPSGGKVRISLVVFDSLQEVTDWWAKETGRFGAQTWMASSGGESAPGTGSSQAIKWHVYCVEDSGIGVLPADLPHLVEAYRQISHGASRSHAGTGLGLHICRTHMEAMCGSFGIASTFSEKDTSGGTLFAVVLPLDSEEPGAAVNTQEPLEAEVNLRLLDHKIRRFFKDNGADVEVMSATDGFIALEMHEAARRNQSHGSVLAGMFIDFHMPDLDGIECTKRIRLLEADNGWSRIMICGCTADPTQAIRRVFQNAGGDEVISKPWCPGQVESICNAMVANVLNAEQKSGGDGGA
ncbi:Phytochrome-like protein 3 [Ectocarpus siliculosus]|uniref:histidine kinase n=1 Tax=Ectocarpus siliculosus TaxID=2880 RepID=D7G6T2_ECTSI|nr:Phytochrome-like protein 3 [Ectocarpus siliculosus]|eukprot:CBJ33980.1 Phytochrome-like protein 3 [Ectocarpus siliculosus]